MAVEISFLSSVSAFLSGLSITPAPKISVAEPVEVADLPAVVLSLEQAVRPSVGLGDRGSVIRQGALEWQAEIDLAQPWLPDDPGHTFPLVSEDRLRLTLPHGGLVHRDGTTEGPLTGTDLTVMVAGTDRPVVPGTPVGLEVLPDAGTGILTFATALPLSGKVEATYFLGQWERRVERLNGVLRLDVVAGSSAHAQTVADAVLNALLGPAAKQGVARLQAIALQSLGSIGLVETAAGNGRRRQARLSFQFEHDVDQPESAGGVIRQIPVTANVGVVGS
jgi:hypothetical protein